MSVKLQLLWPKRGDLATIKKGTALRSTNPSRKSFVAGRTHTVKVHDVYHWGANEGRPAYVEIVWAGAHGYWTYALLSDL